MDYRLSTVAERAWIAEVVAKAAVVDKLHRKHHLTLSEVDEAVALGQHDTARWDDHPTYGRRLVVRGTTVAGGGSSPTWPRTMTTMSGR